MYVRIKSSANPLSLVLLGVASQATLILCAHKNMGAPLKLELHEAHVPRANINVK